MPGSASRQKNLPPDERNTELSETYVFAGRFEYEFEAHHRTESATGEYLIVLKADGTVLVHDGIGYKPMAWMTRPTEVRLNETGVPLIVAKDAHERVADVDTETLTIRPVTPVVSFDARVPRDLPMSRGSMARLLRQRAMAVDEAVEHFAEGLEAGWPTDDMVIRAAKAVDELCHVLRDIQRSK